MVSSLIDRPEIQQAASVLDCAEDVLAFAAHVHLSDPLRGDLALELWPFQRDLLQTWETEQRVIVLKARQLGVSWLAALYAVWTALYHQGANVLILSKRQDEATALLGKCKYIIQHLPDWMRPTIGKDNDTTIELARLGSRILALPATEDAGRSETASLVIVDEAAFHPHAEANYAAYKPTIDAGGKLILISTANGRGNFYQRIWTGAPGNGFTPVFLRWDLRPGRDADWWARQQAEYAATPHLLAQEYPGNPSEAFISSGHCLFDVAAINRSLNACRPPIETHHNGLFKVWQRPIVGRRYVAGADVAEGKDAGNDKLDYSGVAIYDWQTCAHVADLHGQWPVDVYAQLINDYCREYNDALLGVERNNHGHAVLLMLKQLQYPNLYWHDEATVTGLKDRAKHTRELGWPTTTVTKPLLEQDLGAAISSGGLLSYDERFWDECLSYVQLGNGKSGAQSGCHDDRVIKHAIALQMRKQPAPQQAGPLLSSVPFRMGKR